MHFMHTRGWSQSPVWLSEADVQHALFALPQPTTIELQIDPGEKLLKKAVARAKKLVKARIFVDSERNQFQLIRALRAAPALTSLELLPLTSHVEPPFAERFHAKHQRRSGEPRLEPFCRCLPPTLTWLHIHAFSVRSEVASRAALKTMFARLPLLRILCYTANQHDRMDPAPLFQGMLDAGAAALAHLRCVEICVGNADTDREELIRRFRCTFPRVEVKLFTLDDDDDGGDDDEERNQEDRRLSQRVLVKQWAPVNPSSAAAGHSQPEGQHVPLLSDEEVDKEWGSDSEDD